MGTAYSARQSTYADGDTINADDTNDEFDAILAAFGTSGHTHDGTAGEGGAITGLLSHTITFGAGTAGTDITITFDGESNDGVLAWMEDEDYFRFSDDILINSTEKIMFGDTASFIHQSSDGVLTIDGEATIDLNASTAVLVSNDLKLNSDAAVLGFGVDNDVTLTHVADTGVLLNSTMAIQFNDASQYINAPSATVLDINATDEVEVNATLMDVNANLDVSGTYTGAGLMTTGGNIVIPNAGNIGSASDTDAIAISSGGVVTFSQTPVFSSDLTLGDDLYLDSDGAVIHFGDDGDITLTHAADTGLTTNGTFQATTITATTAVVPDASDGAALGTTSLEWSDLYLADGAVIGFGDDQDVTLTHVADTGLLLNGTMAIQFNDASQYINAPSNAILDINATDEIELNATLVDVNANVEISGTSTLSGKVTHSYTSSSRMPVGTTGERDGSPGVGDFRYNSTTNEFEGYAGSSPAWGSIGGGAGYFKGDNGTVGSSAGDIFRVNEAALDANVTISATENASATGPITISNSYTLTVEGTLVII